MLLAQYKAGNDESVDINALPERNVIASARGPFDNHTLIAAGALTHDEVERLRPRVYEIMAENADETPFYTIHDAFHSTTDGEPMVSTKATRGALYIVRTRSRSSRPGNSRAASASVHARPSASFARAKWAAGKTY